MHKSRPKRRRGNKKLRKAEKRRLMHRQQNRDSRVTNEYGEQAHRQCGKKARYRSKIDALIAANRCTMRGAPKLRAYRCPYCGGWHLTSH